MYSDRQLRERAEELRRQLHVTMHQTNEAIISTMRLTDEIARCRKRDVLTHRFAQTTEKILSSRKRLDGRNS